MNKIIPQDSDELFDSSPDSGEEFVPYTEDSSSDCSAIIEVLPSSQRSILNDSFTPSPDLPDSTTCVNVGFEERSTNSAEEDGDTSPGNMNLDKEDVVFVSGITKKEDGSRLYNKKQYCLFCPKSYIKMARHLEQVHSNEREVARAYSFKKGSKERRILLNDIRNRGNYAHNAAVLKDGKGELVPHKRPTGKSQANNYMHCAYCKGLFVRHLLWRHMRNCKLHPKVATSKPGKTRVQALCAFMDPAPDHISKKLWELTSKMAQDEVTNEVKKDKCIMQLGQHMLNKSGSNPKRQEHIRQKLREIGRLLIHVRKVLPITEMKDVIDPKYYLATVKAVKLTCGYNSETENFKVGTLALKLGHSLGKLAKLVESNGRIAENHMVVEKARSFQQVHAAKWNALISSTALRNIEEGKWNMPTVMPFTEDVQALHRYLWEKRQECIDHLTAEPTAQHWSSLAKVLLAEVILFNRRREGEVSCMPLIAFTSRDTSDPNQDIDWALSEVEKKLCRHFSRIETRGKRGRKVPILLTPKMLSGLELLVQQRNKCGVPKDNTYMFARPGAMSHFRGSDCIRTFGRACGAKHPNALSSTKLRKQIATLSTVLNMNDTDMDQLANFMGHDIRIHREYYRLPEGTLQLAKISKVLMALEQGKLADFKGKNLDEIEIHPDGLFELIDFYTHRSCAQMLLPKTV